MKSNKIEKARQVLKMSKEAKKLMKDERSNFVLELYLRAYRSVEIEQAYVAKFNETARNARNYIKKVKDTIKKEAQTDREAEIQKAAKQFDMLYKQFLEAGKPELAMQALEKKNKLLGYEAAKQVVTTNFSINATAAEDQFKSIPLAQRIEALRLLQLNAPNDNEAGTGAEVTE